MGRLTGEVKLMLTSPNSRGDLVLDGVLVMFCYLDHHLKDNLLLVNLLFDDFTLMTSP